jgi:2-dehydropantoate 2-reductase
MRIAVLGAGGIGGYFGGTLARAGHEVQLLARGVHLDAIRIRGLEVRTPAERFTVPLWATADPAELGRADLALVAVKGYSLSEVAPAARMLADRGATILPLLNGVNATEQLAALGVAEDRLLGGLAFISVARTAAGVIERRSSFERVVVGELAGGRSARAEGIADAFRSAGAEARVSEAITVELWQKFIFITTVAAACGLARSPLGEVRSRPLGRLLIERAIHEVAAVARARGVALPADEEGRTLQMIDELPASMKPSFLLDLEHGGPTELDTLSGTVSRLGREHGVETVVHDTVVAALGKTKADD